MLGWICQPPWFVLVLACGADGGSDLAKAVANENVVEGGLGLVRGLILRGSSFFLSCHVEKEPNFLLEPKKHGRIISYAVKGRKGQSHQHTPKAPRVGASCAVHLVGSRWVVEWQEVSCLPLMYSAGGVWSVSK